MRKTKADLERQVNYLRMLNDEINRNYANAKLSIKAWEKSAQKQLIELLELKKKLGESQNTLESFIKNNQINYSCISKDLKNSQYVNRWLVYRLSLIPKWVQRFFGAEELPK